MRERRQRRLLLFGELTHRVGIRGGDWHVEMNPETVIGVVRPDGRRDH